MKLATYITDTEQRIGVIDVDRGTFRDASSVLPPGFSLIDLVSGWSEHGAALTAAETALPDVPLSDARLVAPFPVPRRNVFCVGKNYRDHVAEFGRSGYDMPDRSQDLPEYPVVFSKATTSVAGPYDDINPHTGVTSELDYEGELGVVIGTGGIGISRDDAYAHVWGYTVINDVTARDLQRDHKQWLIGKSLDTHCPMGPWIVSADEIADVTALHLQTTVNGELRQDATVKELIFDIPELIAQISAGITLMPGDVIATGTPAGVGIGFDPPKFLHTGDVVEVNIGGLGGLRNTVA